MIIDHETVIGNNNSNLSDATRAKKEAEKAEASYRNFDSGGTSAVTDRVQHDVMGTFEKAAAND